MRMYKNVLTTRFLLARWVGTDEKVARAGAVRGVVGIEGGVVSG